MARVKRDVFVLVFLAVRYAVSGQSGMIGQYGGRY